MVLWNNPHGVNNLQMVPENGSPASVTVSVIIPMYNGEDFVGATIESVLRQTRPVQEILIVDDGSTDRSAEIARSYPGVRVLSFENGGISTARNRGIAAATSEWIALLDDDDVWVEDKIERQLAQLEQHPEADVCVCSHQMLVDGQLREVRRLPPDFTASVERGCFALPSSGVIRRSALLAHPFDDEIPAGEDWDLWLRLKRNGIAFAVCEEPLLHYRQHANNVSGRAIYHFRTDLAIYDRHMIQQVPRLLRPAARWIRISRLLAERGVLERQHGQPHLGFMVASLLRWPLGNWKRYKVGTHMVLKRLGLIGRMRYAQPQADR